MLRRIFRGRSQKSGTPCSICSDLAPPEIHIQWDVEVWLESSSTCPGCALVWKVITSYLPVVKAAQLLAIIITSYAERYDSRTLRVLFHHPKSAAPADYCVYTDKGMFIANLAFLDCRWIG